MRNLPTMELAINNVPKDLKNRLEKAWNFATAGNGNSAKKIYFNKPNERLKSEINKVFRKNIDIDNQIITLGHIRHINNRHGINGEIKSKVPMTKEIFAIIPYVLNNFDSLEKSNIQSRGNDVIKIKKKFLNGTIVIADAIIKHNLNKSNLEIRTIYVD